MEYTGLDVPLKVNKSGGFATVSGDDQNKKIIMLAVDYCPSENPFNTDVGIEHPIFGINDVSLQSRSLIRIKEVFRNFQNQNRMKYKSSKFSSVNEELVVDIDYIDMQTDRPESVRKTFIGAGSLDV